MNLRNLLLLRANFATPRDHLEDVASVMDERNRALRAAWLVRWHQRRALPDAARSAVDRAALDAALEAKRRLAWAWLKIAPAPRSLPAAKNVITLRARRK